MNVFYNYIAYVNDKPIYVGKGKDKRYTHCYKKFPNCIVKIYNENSSEKDAFNWEINKIEEIGLKNLANKVPGGFGVDTISNNPNKHDICKRISETVKTLHKKGVYPPRYWANGVKGMSSKESVKKRTEAQRGIKKYIKNKEEWRKKISESLKGEKNPMFGKKSWNSGKKMHIKNLELANKRKSEAAKNRKKFKCLHCLSCKEYDAGNLTKHIKAYHTNKP